VSSRATSRLWITAAHGFPVPATVILSGFTPKGANQSKHPRLRFLRLGWKLFLLLALVALPAAAQYQGQIDTSKNAPRLRAVGVLEWTGAQQDPKTSRLIPICVYDGQELQDASVYLSRPEPLALESEVEYQLLDDGKPAGFFVIQGAGRQLGSWVGFGKWKSLPKPKPAPAQLAKIDQYDDAQSDEPVLHRAGDAARGNSGSSSGAGNNAPAPDPNRPTLHRGGDTSDSGSGSGSGGSNSSGSDANAPPPDPDRPILHADTNSSGNASTDPGATKRKKKNDDDEAYVSDVATLSDPDRPHLFRGKAAGYAAPVLPALVGLPLDMRQEVAVSDAVNRPVHVWSYSWSNPADEAKMKADLEDLARTALGLNPPPAPASKKSTTTHSKAKPAPALPPPAPLLVEQFRVFELAYGSGATMVLSAHTAGTGEQEKFVTLIAQPDLYGNVAVLFKSVTDAAHLDDTPRMKLIDAVDAEADNRGELLFELRGATQRQFALYRVLRGDATRIFLSSVQPIGIPGAPAAN
jgi:hypothetical protein